LAARTAPEYVAKIKVNLHAHELGRQRSGPFFSTFGVAAFDPNVLAFHETLSAELLEEGIVERPSGTGNRLRRGGSHPPAGYPASQR